jgi:hypothetical protein
MKVSTARYLSNIPEGASIYGKFTQRFGHGVAYEDACERLAIIIEHNGPTGYCEGEIADRLGNELTIGLDWPNDGCEITFYLYATEE